MHVSEPFISAKQNNWSIRLQQSLLLCHFHILFDHPTSRRIYWHTTWLWKHFSWLPKKNKSSAESQSKTKALSLLQKHRALVCREAEQQHPFTTLLRTGTCFSSRHMLKGSWDDSIYSSLESSSEASTCCSIASVIEKLLHTAPIDKEWFYQYANTPQF